MNWIPVTEQLPPAKEGFSHSERCVVFYPAESVEGGRTARYGIAYYHYEPPFRDAPVWIDFAQSGHISHWKPLDPPK